MKITLKPGDHVRTEGISDAEYEFAINTFYEARCPFGEGRIENWKDYQYFGWGIRGLYHSNVNSSLDGRELSLSDLLGDEEAPPVGKGIPQIGASVLAKNLDNEFSRFNELTVSIVGHFDDGDDGGVVIFHPSRGHASLSNHHLFLFPIKSERELAIEEMKESFLMRFNCTCSLEFLGQLYDAGYRKIKDAEK